MSVVPHPQLAASKTPLVEVMRTAAPWFHPALFGVINLCAIILVLTFSVNMADLATATGLFLLVVFTVVNAALTGLKRRPGEPRGAFEVPVAVPALGIVVCGTLVAVRVWEALHRPGGWVAPVTSLVILVAILVLYAIMRPREVKDFEV